jgi:hypothetical protein
VILVTIAVLPFLSHLLPPLTPPHCLLPQHWQLKTFYPTTANMSTIHPAPPQDSCDASAVLEKNLSPDNNLAGETARNSTSDPLKKADSHRYLNEEQALDWCRKYPESREPIYITYSADDKENPRYEREIHHHERGHGLTKETATGQKDENGTSPV